MARRSAKSSSTFFPLKSIWVVANSSASHFDCELSSMFCVLKASWVVASLSRIALPKLPTFPQIFLPLKTTWVVAWLAGTSMHDSPEIFLRPFLFEIDLAWLHAGSRSRARSATFSSDFCPLKASWVVAHRTLPAHSVSISIHPDHLGSSSSRLFPAR